MASNHQNGLYQLILAKNKKLIKGAELKSLLWSAGGSVLLCLLLIELWLIAGLLINRGRLVVPTADITAFYEIIPESLEPADEKRLKETAASLSFQDRGILPSIWTSRSCPCGGFLSNIYGRIPPLQSNATALAFLVFCCGVTGSLAAMMYSRGRTHSLHAAIDITKNQRQAVHRQALRLGPSEIQDDRNGELQGLFAEEMDGLQESLTTTISRITRDPLKLLMLLILAFSVNPFAGAIVIFPLCGCWLLMAWQRQTGEAARKLGKSRSQENMKLLAESLRTTRLVRGYGKETEAFENKQFQQHLTRLCDETTQWMQQSWVHRWGLAAVAAFSGSLVVLMIGQWILKVPPSLSLSSAMLLLGATALMQTPLRNLWYLKRDVEEGTHVASRIERYLHQTPPVGQAVGAKFLQPMAKKLVFDNVVCRGPGQQTLLDGCSFQIKAGTQIALVSTDAWEARCAAYLLPRFLEPHSGQILIDGEDIAWVTIESLRAETILVSARDPFFTGSILENIRCGDAHYSLQEITEAAKVTHAHNFIMKLQQGYETVIGEHGEQLDPGQAFRLGLARAMLRGPALLIIEEPEQPLDEDTKALLDDAYNRIGTGRTIIFLPHRMATLRRVDEIVMLHQGKVATMGNHPALVKSSPLYCHWEYLNFNEFRHEAREKE